MNNLKFSKETLFYEIENDTFVGWNRFYPKLLRLNKEAVDFIKNIEKMEIIPEKYSNIVDELVNNKLLYEENKDPSKEYFLAMVENEYELIKRKAEEFFQLNKHYSQLYINNDLCNLKCPYCAKKYKNFHSPVRISLNEKIELINLVIDQYIKKKIENNFETISVSLNGGEILLEWDIIKAIVLRNCNKYPKLKFKFSVNTNMTLLTPEIAEFMSRYDFTVDISIDGYESAHDMTRQYHNGKGSFHDVLKGLNIYKKYFQSEIKEFQGTIENSNSFTPEKVFEMNQLGFKTARLAPNLLNISEEDAKKKAIIMINSLNLNLKNDFQVTDTIFDVLRGIMYSKDYKFRVFCNGLSGLPRMGIYFNISTMRLSNLCTFVSEPTVHLKEIDYNIYNPKLWELSRRFIQRRIEIIKNFCINCELVALCRGGCVLSGIDCENKINESACRFQKEFWKLFLDYLYKNEMKIEAIN